MRLDAAREHALQRTPRGARGAHVAGGDQVGDGLGLGEVELAVEEGALAELARPCLARAQRDAARHQLRSTPGCRAPAVRPRPRR
jgi:hypothetical protein